MKLNINLVCDNLEEILSTLDVLRTEIENEKAGNATGCIGNVEFNYDVTDCNYLFCNCAGCNVIER